MRSFGDGQSCSGSDLSPLHFTGKPRDLETGLDDFGARPYSSSLGRWSTPDWSAEPEAVPYADLSDPQTLNLYAYAENNPVTRTDADGHIPIDDTWMQTGHDMQEVGFAFHLSTAQPEGEAKGGCTVNVVAPRPHDIALQFVRSWAWQAWVDGGWMGTAGPAPLSCDETVWLLSTRDLIAGANLSKGRAPAAQIRLSPCVPCVRMTGSSRR